MILNHLIKAKFIGKDGSLGYRKNKEYFLLICRFSWIHRLFNGWEIEIKRVDGNGWCPYKNMAAFTANWEITKPIIKKLTEKEVKLNA